MTDTTDILEAVDQRSSVKKVFLEIFHRKTSVPEYLF